jgi:hypothetical protein
MLAMLLMSIGASAQSQLKGDVNNDGKVDEADITAVIEIMKNGGGVTDSNDVNKDGKVDVADIVAIIGIIKNGGSSSGEVFDPNSYYIYIGLDRPTSDTDIAADLASNNTPLYEDCAAVGWRSIGPDISIYNSSNPAYNGGGYKSTVCLDKNFNNVTCYIAIPVGMGIFDIFSEDTSWTLDQANITIKGHQYNVYKTVLEGEFTLLIY